MGSAGLGPNIGVDDLAFRDSNHGLLIGSDFSASSLVASTTDGGMNWTVMNAPPEPFLAFLDWVPGTSTYIATNFFDILGGPGSAYTTDDGVTWNVIDSIPQRSCGLYETQWSGLERWRDPRSWARLAGARCLPKRAHDVCPGRKCELQPRYQESPLFKLRRMYGDSLTTSNELLPPGRPPPGGLDKEALTVGGM